MVKLLLAENRHDAIGVEAMISVQEISKSFKSPQTRRNNKI